MKRVTPVPPHLKEKCLNQIIAALASCPHVIKEGIGAEEFVKELIKGTEALIDYNLQE